MSTAPKPKSNRAISPARIATLIVVAIAVALVSSAGFYTDVLWYEQLGFSSVLFTQLWAKVAIFGVAAVTMGGLVGLSIWLAFRGRPIYATGAGVRDPFAQVRELINQLRKGIMIGVPVVLAVLAGLAATSRWDEALLFINGVDTPKQDAQFQLDVSFYLFKLPFLLSLIHI